MAFFRKLIARLTRKTSFHFESANYVLLDADHHMDRVAEAWAKGNLAHAATLSREILNIQPTNAKALANLGMIIFEMRDFEEGLSLLRLAVSLDSGLAVAHCNLGIVLAQGGLMDEAATHLETALKLDPQNNIYANLINLYQQNCQWEALRIILDRSGAMKLDADILTVAERIAPYTAMLLPLSGPVKRQISDYHAAKISVAHSPRQWTPQQSVKSDRRIRIGYLSCDFYDHATAHLAAGLFECHDCARFDVYAYSWGPLDASGYRERIKSACASFIDVTNEGFCETAARIHRDGIDILVDMKGHTGGGRPEILGYRSAPIQVNYLGCPGTLGGNLADYFVTDLTATPEAAECEFSENLVILPHTYQINDTLVDLPPPKPRAAYGLPDSGFVFCCFNALYKIEESVFFAWVKILERTPESVLWLLNSNSHAANNIQQRFVAAGIDRGRIIFAPFLPRSQHLARLQLAGLFIDTRYVNAHTTASDALRAGVPLLSWTGNTFAARVGTSLLHASGLQDLAVGGTEEYVELATRLALCPELLDEIRNRLLQNRGSPLFDTARYTRNLECAYEQMWARHSNGLRPARIEVEENLLSS